jgi:hypothetical protein
MHPLVRGAAAAAVLTALGGLDRDRPDPAPAVVPPAQAKGVDGFPAPCGAGTLPEGPVCVRVPGAEAATALPAPGDRGPRSLGAQDRIPRRPERSADAAAYTYPIGTPERPPKVLGGFEDPAPVRTYATGAAQGGIHLAARPSERVLSVKLEGQEGPGEVVLTGELFGFTVVTAHRVREAGQTRTYLLFHGRLERADDGIDPGAHVEAGDTLGFARESERGHIVEIYVEARQVREGVKLDGADGKKLTDASVAIPIDLRNVLPLR